jgi:hypothetical protein
MPSGTCNEPSQARNKHLRDGKVPGTFPSPACHAEPTACHDHGMAKLEQARWWAVRPVRSRKPATYRCPLCGLRLHAMSDHLLISPEGDGERRRHAHRECVLAAREAGRLPLYDEWRKTQPRPPSLWRRVLRRS